MASLVVPRPLRLTQSRPAPVAALNTDQTALTRRCTACHTRKPLIEFHRSKKEPFGHIYTCKVCRAEQVRSRS
jgi:predicted SprT family Zn-dependent metalloprotease